MTAVSSGEITPSEAVEIGGRLLETYVRTLEVTELEGRLRKLEEIMSNEKIYGRIRKLEKSRAAKQWGYVVISDGTVDDLSKVDLDNYPFTWVDANKVVYVVDDGPPMTNEEWEKEFCTPG